MSLDTHLTAALCVDHQLPKLTDFFSRRLIVANIHENKREKRGLSKWFPLFTLRRLLTELVSAMLRLLAWVLLSLG